MTDEPHEVHHSEEDDEDEDEEEYKNIARNLLEFRRKANWNRQTEVEGGEGEESNLDAPKEQISTIQVYEPKFFEIYCAYDKAVNAGKQNAVGTHLMTSCLEHLIPFSCWARESNEKCSWVWSTLDENPDLRPVVRNGLAMILVYILAAAYSTRCGDTDMFAVLQNPDTGLGIVNKTSLKIYNDPFGYFTFLKFCISGLIDAGRLPENERQNQPKKLKKQVENKEEVAAFLHMKSAIVSILSTGNNSLARERVQQILTLWQEQSKCIRTNRFSMTLKILYQSQMPFVPATYMLSDLSSNYAENTEQASLPSNAGSSSVPADMQPVLLQNLSHQKDDHHSIANHSMGHAMGHHLAHPLSHQIGQVSHQIGHHISHQISHQGHPSLQVSHGHQMGHHSVGHPVGHPVGHHQVGHSVVGNHPIVYVLPANTVPMNVGHHNLFSNQDYHNAVNSSSVLKSESRDGESESTHPPSKIARLGNGAQDDNHFVATTTATTAVAASAVTSVSATSTTTVPASAASTTTVTAAAATESKDLSSDVGGTTLASESELSGAVASTTLSRPLRIFRFERVGYGEWKFTECRVFDLADFLSNCPSTLFFLDEKKFSVEEGQLREVKSDENKKKGLLAGFVSLQTELQRRQALVASWPRNEFSQLKGLIAHWDENPASLSLLDFWKTCSAKSYPFSSSPRRYSDESTESSGEAGVLAYENVVHVGLVVRECPELDMRSDCWRFIYPNDLINPETQHQSFGSFLIAIFPQMKLALSIQKDWSHIVVKYYPHKELRSVSQAPERPPPGAYQTIGTLDESVVEMVSRWESSQPFYDIFLDCPPQIPTTRR